MRPSPWWQSPAKLFHEVTSALCCPRGGDTAASWGRDSMNLQGIHCRQHFFTQTMNIHWLTPYVRQTRSYLNKIYSNYHQITLFTKNGIWGVRYCLCLMQNALYNYVISFKNKKIFIYLQISKLNNENYHRCPKTIHFTLNRWQIMSAVDQITKPIKLLITVHYYSSLTWTESKRYELILSFMI